MNRNAAARVWNVGRAVGRGGRGRGGPSPGTWQVRRSLVDGSYGIIVFGPGVDDVDVDVNIGLQASMSFLTQGVPVMHDGNQMVAVLGIQ